MRCVKENWQIFVSYWRIIGQWHIIGHNLDDLIFRIISLRRVFKPIHQGPIIKIINLIDFAVFIIIADK